MNTQEWQLLNAFERFQTRIKLSTNGLGPDMLDNVISKNVKVAYYLESVTPSFTYTGIPRLVLDIRYKNTDVSPNDIFVISSPSQVNSVLCQRVGNYKACLVLLAKPNVDVASEIQRFYTVNAPFYPNFVSASVSAVHNSLISMNCFELSFTYRIGKVKLSMMENAVDAEVERIAKQLFLPGMSNETKALLAHNYLADSITYTMNEKANNLERSYLQSAYGALINKKCVCQGYAEAFKRLMDYAKIPCDIVCGQIKGMEDYHAWNIIMLNNGLDNYHIDTTWDSAGDGVAYTYFGLKDSDFIADRIWSREYTPACNSAKNLLSEGRRGIMRFRSQLLANGVSARIIGY